MFLGTRPFPPGNPLCRSSVLPLSFPFLRQQCSLPFPLLTVVMCVFSLAVLRPAQGVSLQEVQENTKESSREERRDKKL